MLGDILMRMTVPISESVPQSGIVAWECNAVWVPTPEQEEDPLEEDKPGSPGSQNGGTEVTVH